jgi:hypothetical protein
LGAISYDAKEYNKSNKIGRNTFLNIRSDYLDDNLNIPIKSTNTLNQNIYSKTNKSRNNSPNANYTSSNNMNISDQRNNAIKFSNYTNRKDIFMNAENPILTYQNPEDILKTAKTTMIDFNKMKQRNVNDILNVNNYPAVCYYKPDPKFTQDNPKHNFEFKKEKITSKKYLIKKMWGSYDVCTDYKLVKLQNYVEEQFDFRDAKYKK